MLGGCLFFDFRRRIRTVVLCELYSFSLRLCEHAPGQIRRLYSKGYGFGGGSVEVALEYDRWLLMVPAHARASNCGGSN